MLFCYIVFGDFLKVKWAMAPGCDTGAILLISASDREIYFSTQPGFRNVVSDSQLSKIIANMGPSLFYFFSVNDLFSEVFL